MSIRPSENAEVPPSVSAKHSGEARNSLIRYACTIFSIEKSSDGLQAHDPKSAVFDSATTNDFMATIGLDKRLSPPGRYDKITREADDLECLWNKWKSHHDGNIRFIIGQLESAPSTKSLHIQFYVVLTRKVRITTIRKYFNAEGRHFNAEQCKGTHSQNIAYVTKESSRYAKLPVIGDESLTAKDLEDGAKVGKIARLIDTAQREGIRAALIELPVTGLQNFRNLHSYIEAVQPPRPAVRANIFLSGPPRCGKTRFAYALSNDILYAKTHGKWFDGYRGEKIILWDEIHSLDIPTALLLRATDRYPLTVEVKGGSTALRSRINIFTSNRSFANAIFGTGNTAEETKEAIRDRFNLLLVVTDKKETPDCVTWPITSIKRFLQLPSSQSCIFHRDAYIYVSHFTQGTRFTPAEIQECFTDAAVYSAPAVLSAPDLSAPLEHTADDTEDEIPK